ncbi:putative nucleotidyltransferase substrate binding domain-containing protein [Halorhodospira abdelmalekii]|uniref:putative nucleotidyltransferase substrate binding domain-containing protein n=1 Tax=Halorhodospira abdelmalekii TaxID=421629 RepID=UPI001F5BF015|nr:putative nucleotidyltransferase substrate binding domain-containing protein [Halorhodospira abdelmalekii]
MSEKKHQEAPAAVDAESMADAAEFDLAEGGEAGDLQRWGGDTSLDVPIGEHLRHEPVTCLADATIRSALQAMDQERIGSIVVVDERFAPVGVFTHNDLLRRVALPEVDLETSIASVMTPDPVGMGPSAFAFEAAMLMAAHGIHHICVVEDGVLRGVVSERDLFSLQRVGLVNLTRTIRRARSLAALTPLQEDIRGLVGQMIAQGVKVAQILQIITLLNDHIVEQVIALCLEEADEAEALAGIRFTWIAFGSEGRREQTLRTDQDNGILFEVPEGMSADEVRALLLPMARRINQALADCGYLLCPGNIMAGNPECCLSFSEWQQRFLRWIDQGTPEHLLNAAIFFDFRAISGPEAGVEALREWLLQRTAQNSRFRRQMAANALRNRPPLGWLRDFVTQSWRGGRNTLDLKLNGVTPFTDAARIFAVAYGLSGTNTLERLEQAVRAGRLDAGEVEAWRIAYEYIQNMRIRKQHEQILAGSEPDNRVSPDGFNELDRRILKEVFRETRKLQSKLASDYQL